MKSILIPLVMMLSMSVFGQDQSNESSYKYLHGTPKSEPFYEEVEECGESFIRVEAMPEYPGGDTELLKYLSKIPYPRMAIENDIEQTVYIRFLIEKDGSITNVEVARSADELLDDAAIKHVAAMPNWIPGKQRGKPVCVQYIIPIRFRLG